MCLTVSKASYIFRIACSYSLFWDLKTLLSRTLLGILWRMCFPRMKKDWPSSVTEPKHIFNLSACKLVSGTLRGRVCAVVSRSWSHSVRFQSANQEQGSAVNQITTSESSWVFISSCWHGGEGACELCCIQTPGGDVQTLLLGYVTWFISTSS